ncbi:MAG: sensor histidine kinase [Lachnospiraceae bacterium]|nr:sensor histidine kinase [Lachnospiraceae bacterium]
MEMILNTILFSLVMGLSCHAFFTALFPPRRLRPWMEYTAVLAFLAGFLLIAFTRIPPYIFQPLRFILVVFLAAQLYFRVTPLKNLAACVLLCALYWLTTMITVSALSSVPLPLFRRLTGEAEKITAGIFLCMMLLFHYKYKNRFLAEEDVRWTRFALFPLLGLILVLSLAMVSLDGTVQNSRAMLAALFSFAAINVCLFYWIGDFLKKEREMQKFRLIQERTLSQMNQYRSIQKSYEAQKRYLHDYKNQLDCIQGMLQAGKSGEALAYITGLRGSLKESAVFVSTNHPVVDVVLNQKYQQAREKDIVMTMSVNDLSSLSMSDEFIVTLLGNLLDNAIEGCERLGQDGNKVIQFKMLTEDGQLILSVRNPAPAPLQIKNNRIVTQKADPQNHGIGLLNIDSVIKAQDGTGILKWEDGWICYSAMIPLCPSSHTGSF